MVLISAVSSQTKSELSRSLGWTPQETDSDFKNHFQAEVEKLLEAKEKK